MENQKKKNKLGWTIDWVINIIFVFLAFFFFYPLTVHNWIHKIVFYIGALIIFFDPFIKKCLRRYLRKKLINYFSNFIFVVWFTYFVFVGSINVWSTILFVIIVIVASINIFTELTYSY